MEDDENACVRNIVKEIMREIVPKKIKVNKNFVTYLTKLLLVDPNWGIGDDFFNQRQNVQIFVKYMTDDLLQNMDDPKIVTLKIQFYFSCNLEHMDYAIESNKTSLRNKLLPLKNDILHVQKMDDKEDADSLFKKIVFYIILATGLGNPEQPKVYEEALVALKSILYEEELKDFIELPKYDKYAQLVQLTKVIGGMRLFNKDCDKGGEGIADLPDLLDKAIVVIRKGTEETLLLIMERVNTLTTIVDNCYVIRPTYKGNEMQFVADNRKSIMDIEYIKNLLIFFRQYELLIRKVLDHLDRIQDKSELILVNMVKMFKTVHKAVYMKIAIPVGDVIPLFDHLWDIWEELQDQGILISKISMIMGNLETYAKQTRYEPLTIDHLIGASTSLTDAERLAQTSHLRLVSSNPEVAVLRSDTIKNFQNIKLEYLGFCCWKLIETDGALIPGNPAMGIVVYKQKNYVFSCTEGFIEFLKDPQTYINSVLDLGRRKPQIINFFQLKEDLEKASTIVKLVESKAEIKMCEDKSLQTVLHTTDGYKDPNYKWNVWDLKREALTLANLSASVTRSSQTYKTGSDNSMRIQTYQKRRSETQTKRAAYSNVPKPSVFMYGLRGRKDSEQFKIDLTRPVEE